MMSVPLLAVTTTAVCAGLPPGRAALRAIWWPWVSGVGVGAGHQRGDPGGAVGVTVIWAVSWATLAV